MISGGQRDVLTILFHLSHVSLKGDTRINNDGERGSRRRRRRREGERVYAENRGRCSPIDGHMV